MKEHHLKVFALLLASLFSWNALADGGRECVFDADSGMYLPPNGSGACFGDDGLFVAVADAVTGDLVLAANPPADKQWFRINPNGQGRFHSAADGLFLVYCSAATVAADACNPLSGEAFEGTARIRLNTRLQDLFFTCPLTVRITGTASDGFGNTVEVMAALTTVPDADLGCRATVNRIDAIPVID
jgi:hypothetical protein